MHQRRFPEGGFRARLQAHVACADARVRCGHDWEEHAREGHCAGVACGQLARRVEARGGEGFGLAGAVGLCQASEPVADRQGVGARVGRRDVRDGLLRHLEGVRRQGHGRHGEGVGREPGRDGDGARLHLRLARGRGPSRGSARVREAGEGEKVEGGAAKGGAEGRHGGHGGQGVDGGGQGHGLGGACPRRDARGMEVRRAREGYGAGRVRRRAGDRQVPRGRAVPQGAPARAQRRQEGKK